MPRLRGYTRIHAVGGPAGDEHLFFASRQGVTTWISPDARTRAQIDYVCVDEGSFQQVTSAEARPDMVTIAGGVTDHYPVLMEMVVNGRTPACKNPCPYSKNMFLHPEAQKHFVDRVTNRVGDDITCLMQSGIAARIASLASLLKDAAGEAFVQNAPKAKRKKWISEQTWHLMRGRSLALRAIRAAGSEVRTAAMFKTFHAWRTLAKRPSTRLGADCRAHSFLAAARRIRAVANLTHMAIRSETAKAVRKEGPQRLG